MTLGEYLIRLLEAYEVEQVFGIPGVHTLELYRGLARSRIRHVLPRHEQGAGFMADGYARATGKPGVCLLITGPGLTNALTAMGQAYADSIPMLVISGVNRRSDLGHGHGLLHELSDQRALVAPVTAFTHQLQCAEELPGVLARAFAVFESERPRPVHIEIPIDLMDLDLEGSLAEPVRAPRALAPGDETLAGRIHQAAITAIRPLVLIGGGCARAGREAVAQAVSALGAPAVLTINGRNCLDHEHPLAVPASPSLEAVRTALAEADLIIALGCEIGRTDFDMFATGMPAPPQGRLIRVDIDARQLASSQFPARSNLDDLLVHGDVCPVIAALARLPHAGGPGSERAALLRRACVDELSPAMRAGLGFLETLRGRFPDAILVGDSTQPIYAGNLYFGITGKGGWFNSSVGFGTLGYALPAAIGAKLGRPGQPVIAITGDGGLQFTIAELGAIPPDQPIVVLVWNNHGYGEIKSSMEAVGIEPVGVEFAPPDLELIARAYGLDHALCEPGNDLLDRIGQAVAAGRSILVDIRVS